MEIKTHRSSRFQKSISHPRCCVGWNGAAMGTDMVCVLLRVPGKWVKPTQKMVGNLLKPVSYTNTRGKGLCVERKGKHGQCSAR